MALDSFDPPIAPSPGTTCAEEPRRLIADFGDGYSQRAVDGLNPITPRVSLVWEWLSDDEANAIRIFFAGKGGVTPFTYRPPGERNPQPWICTKWQRARVAKGEAIGVQMTAELERVFDLGT